MKQYVKICCVHWSLRVSLCSALRTYFPLSGLTKAQPVCVVYGMLEIYIKMSSGVHLWDARLCVCSQMQIRLSITKKYTLDEKNEERSGFVVFSVHQCKIALQS